jgi:hypothetical protein
MMRILLTVLLCTGVQYSYAQASPAERNAQSEKLMAEQAAGKDSLLYTDTVNAYQLIVPSWLHIMQTRASLFGGTFPAVDSIENALVIKSFRKEKIGSIGNFEKWVIADYSMGQAPRWGDDVKILLKKKITEFNETGNAWKVQLIWGGRLYDCCYIIAETSKAFLWIDFTATSTTYPVNFEKLKQVVSLFKPL